MVQHTVAHEVFHGGAWHTVSADVHEPSNTVVKRGLDQFGDLKAGSLSFTFLDPDETYVPGNPMSPLYGIAERAMPCRLTVDGSVRCVTEAAVFAPDRPLGETPKVDLRADGLLARIGSWTEPLRSPLYRAVSALPSLVGHWSLEDGRDAEAASNSLPGGRPATIQLMTFGDADAPDGATSAATFDEADNTSRLDFVFEPAATTTGWQVSWALKLPAVPGVTTLQIISWRTSNGYRWLMNTLAGLFQFKAVAPDGTTLLELNGSYTGAEPNQWVMFRLKASVSGGTVTMEPAWYVQGQNVPAGVSGTFAGTVGRLDRGSMNGNAYMDGALVSHVYGVSDPALDLQSYAIRRAFDGFVGELAGDRFGRLLDEAGVDWVLVGDAEDTLPMGRQHADPLSRQLQEIAETDQALIYDARTSNAVEMRTRADMYRQTPVAFAWPGDVAPPFNERYDYVGVANRMTASQRDGGEATEALLSGPMSVLPVPDGIGEKKGGMDVNVSTEALLPDLAGWGLAQGTLPGGRFPEITFDLDARPDLAATVSAIEIGDLIALVGYRYDTIRLIVLALRETVQNFRRLITFTCMPGDVFAQVAEYDDTAARYDSKTTTLKNAVVATFGDRFETGAGSWTGSDATVAHSTAQAHGGTGSLLVTAVGSPAQSYVRDYSRAVPVTPGTTYRCAMWVRSPQTLSVIAAVDYVDNSFGYIGGAYSSTVVLVANTWTRIAVAGAATVGSTQAICGPTILTPANGNTLYLDDIVFGDGAAVPDLITLRTADLDDVWDTAAEPYDIVVSGEVLRVYQMGSASLVSGEYDQAAIVGRGINGVFKELPAADPVHIATPGRYAL